MLFRPERPDDVEAVREVHRRAFGQERVVRLVDVPVLSPLGVLPEHQGRGFGTA